MSEYDAFAAVYDDWVGPIGEDDVEFYVSLAAAAEGPVVELAVGNGRVAVPIAARTGRRVIGIDVSQAMLDGAAKRARAAGVELELRLGDMRELALEQQTDLVICPFRSLLHLHGHDERLRVFTRVSDTLVPGGRFAWNAFVFDPQIAAELEGKWREQGGVRHRVDYDYEERRIDLTLEGGPTIPLWWAAPEAWDRLVEESGLDVEARYGWFDRRPFEETSGEAVYVARKPA
ncbi:MAG TPA: class I SAM-dependent methyltransferase [Gaiella sp.]|jgi:SAM-dependent methyltransferase|nr:class I SAM-dependent methyltransferase [Gaiella sp.]